MNSANRKKSFIRCLQSRVDTVVLERGVNILRSMHGGGKLCPRKVSMLSDAFSVVSDAERQQKLWRSQFQYGNILSYTVHV
jgi:hypothetical protein